MSLTMLCPACGSPVVLDAVQGDRCPGCDLEITLFEPDQEIISREFYRTLTGRKYLAATPDGGQAVVHE